MELETGATLKAKAGTGSAITYTVSGGTKTTSMAYGTIGQGTLTTSATDLLTTTPVPASTNLLISKIHLVNTTASNVSGIVVYINGSASGNQIHPLGIPANGSADFNGDGWHIYDSNGVPQSVGSTGPSGTIAVGTVTSIGTSGPPTVTNSGTSTAAVLNFGLQQGATGSTGAPGAVNTIASANSTIAVTGTTNTNLERAALTGDVTASSGSNATTLAAGSASNLNSGTLLAARMPALTGDTTTTVGTVATTLKNTGPGATGPIGSTSTTPVVTIDAQGRTTALTSATITPAAIGAAPTSRLINTTAPLTGGGDLSADRTLAITAASTSAAGSQSAAQFNTVNNLWFDVTNYGVSIANSGAANTTAMNTLISTTAGAGATFWFPQTGANYPFNGAIVVTKNDQKFTGAGQYSSVLFQNSTTDDLFRINDGVQSTTFTGLGLWSAVTMSAGAAINVGTASGTGAVQTYLNNVGFQGFGGTWFNCIIFNGNRSGEVGLIEYCQFNSFTNYGIAVIGNTTTPSTTSALVVDNTTMNGQITGTTGAVAGIFVEQSGAFNISNSDVISCTNNLLVAPITSVNQISASIYALNSFFDHSHGSCIKLAGTEPIVRTKFTACSFTISNDSGGNYSAFEVSNTATNPPGDLDILNCNIQNTFNNTGTSNGILLTAVANVKIVGNNINGFTNNIQASAAASSATKLNIMGNSIGPGTVTATTSTNDILLNSGTYGYVQIVENIFAPTSPFQTTSTLHIVDNSTVANPGYKNIFNNIGMANSGNVPSIPTAAQALTVAVRNLVTGTSISLPTNGLQVGNKFRFDCILVKTTAAGTGSWIAEIKYGTANTTADAAVASFTAGVNTGAIDTAQFSIIIEVLTLGTSATIKSSVLYIHSLIGATGNGVLPVGGTNTAFNSTSASPFLHLDITPSTTGTPIQTAVATGYQIQ